MLPPSSPFLPFLAVAVMFASALPLFVLGGWVQARVFDGLGAPRPLFLLLAIATSAAVGYAVALCHLAGVTLGRSASTLLWIATAAVLAVPAERRRLGAAFSRADVALPLLAMLGVAAFYATLHFGILPEPLPPAWTWLKHAAMTQVPGAAPDNQYPLWVARRLFEGAILGQLSDRPPLQAGLVLGPLPLWQAAQLATGNAFVVSSAYQVFGTLLQCTWVPAVWALARILGAAPQRAVLVVLALVPTYFFFVHSVFVSPKLLAGAFGVGAYCLLLCDNECGNGCGNRRGNRRGKRGEPSPTRCATAAALAALAFLAHSGVATGLLAFGLVLLWPGFFPGWRNALVAVAVIAALLLPWAAVVRYVAPPGNHIAKVHFAGVKMSERDARTTLEAMDAAYAALPPERLAQKKRAKLLFLLGRDPNRPPVDDFGGFLRGLHRAQFLQVGPSLGLLNVGWVVVGAALVTGRRNRLVGRALGVGCLGLLVWVGIFLSRPYVHVSSYATMMLLFTGLACAILQLPLRLAVPILVVNAAVAPAAILGSAAISSYAPVSLAVAALTGLGLLALLPLAGRFEQSGAT